MICPGCNEEHADGRCCRCGESEHRKVTSPKDMGIEAYTRWRRYYFNGED